MSNVKWIKISVNIFEDDKILMIENMPDADAIIVIWMKLLTLAGKKNNSGVFMFTEITPYDDEILATVFRRPLNTVRFALKAFENLGMIEMINNDIIVLPNWAKHQTLDQLEERNRYMKEYMKKYRNKQKQIAFQEIPDDIELSEETSKQSVEVQCKVNSKLNSKVNVNSLDKIREEKKIERLKDKKIKEFSTPIIEENDFFTKMLIMKEYIQEDDEYISNYNLLFQEIRSNGWKYDDINVTTRYVIEHSDRTTVPIMSRFVFFKKSIWSGLKRFNDK